MATERLLTTENSFSRLSILDKSLSTLVDDSSFSPVVRNAYTWLHEKINSYLMNSVNETHGLDSALVTEYLTLRKTKSKSVRAVYRGLDVPGFKLLLHFAGASVQPDVDGEYSSEEFVHFLEILTELARCNEISAYRYYKQNFRPSDSKRSKQDIGGFKTTINNLGLVNEYGEICQEYFSLPDLTTGIITMTQIDPEKFLSEYIESIWLILFPFFPEIKLDQKEILKKTMKSNMEKAVLRAELLILNSLLGATNLLDAMFHLKPFVDFEVAIKTRARDEFGFW